jgi:hypothetical protein
MDWTMIGSLAAVVGIFGAFFLFVINLILAPVKILIKDNTRAIDRTVDKVDEHDGRLNDHDKRIVRIETVHEMERE